MPAFAPGQLSCSTHAPGPWAVLASKCPWQYLLIPIKPHSPSTMYTTHHPFHVLTSLPFLPRSMTTIQPTNRAVMVSMRQSYASAAPASRSPTAKMSSQLYNGARTAMMAVVQVPGWMRFCKAWVAD